MKYFIFAILLFSTVSANAQWRKVADFLVSEDGFEPVGEGVTCVYFLDLPGPPRIGFTGTESSLWKTTDGGQSWFGVWDTGMSYAHFGVTGICFKDSLIGWFSLYNGYMPYEQCYRTTDGGQNWNLLNAPSYNLSGAQGIVYDSASGRLFLSCDTEIRISTDLGNTWPDSLSYEAFGYSFASPLRGIVDAVPAWEVRFDTFTTIVYLTTSDGGITWDTIYPQGFSPGLQPRQTLAIPGTSTCFTADWGDNGHVWRSDDFGKNWRAVGSIPINDYCSGYIEGNFSRLYIQTWTGMYVSVDSGVTWVNDSGPYANRAYEKRDFYAAKGVTFAGEDGEPGGLGLWEEDWPQSGVTSASPNLPFALSISPNPTSGAATISLTGAPSANVEIFDVLGREVASFRVAESYEWKMGALLAGTYIVRAAIGDVVVSKRMVKE